MSTKEDTHKSIRSSGLGLGQFSQGFFNKARGYFDVFVSCTIQRLKSTFAGSVKHGGTCRFVPENNTLPERVKRILGRKEVKLEPYKKTGFYNCFLLGNGDIALICEQNMLLTIQESYPDHLLGGVDQIWSADPSIPSHWQFVESSHGGLGSSV